MAINVKYSGTSPYYKTPMFDKKFLDILNYKTFPSLEDDIFKPIGHTYQYRPDLMSYDLYGTVEWWWIFMARNRDSIVDPIWDFTADRSIYIPKLTTMISYLGQ